MNAAQVDVEPLIYVEPVTVIVQLELNSSMKGVLKEPIDDSVQVYELLVQ